MRRRRRSWAEREFGQKLDFTSESIDGLDEILVRVGESPELDLDFEVRLWGSYLGEVLRRRYAGAWEMTQYPGGVAAVPAVDVRGSRLFPLMKVYRRLTDGRRRRPARVLHHGDGTAGQARAGELSAALRAGWSGIVASRHCRKRCSKEDAPVAIAAGPARGYGFVRQ